MNNVIEIISVILFISVVANIVLFFINHKTHMMCRMLDSKCNQIKAENRKLDHEFRRFAHENSEFKKHE